MLNQVTGNTNVAALFQADGSETKNSGSKGSASDKGSISKSEVKFDIAAGRKDLEAKQTAQADAKKVQEEGNFSIKLKEQYQYNDHLACKAGKVVSISSNAGFKLSADGTKVESAPYAWGNAQTAVDEANKLVAAEKTAADDAVKALDKDVAELKGKIEKAEKDEEGEYTFLGCVAWPFQKTWGLLTSIGSFFYNLICCNYGDAEVETTEETPETENKGSPAK